MFNFQSLVDYDATVLDGVSLVPDGIDVDTLKGEIMLQCGLLQPLYSEPATMKSAITQWFSARAWTFEHLLNIINAEYSPIENTDRYDQWTRNIDRALDRTDNTTDAISETNTKNLTNTRETDSQVDTSGTTTGQVSAFNSSDWSNSSKDSSTGQTVGDETVTERNTGTDTKTGNNTRRNVADEDEDTTETYTQHLHGNIGVTTNQEMIEQELALLAKFNIYTWIAMNLRDSLFLEVY